MLASLRVEPYRVTSAAVRMSPIRAMILDPGRQRATPTGEALETAAPANQEYPRRVYGLRQKKAAALIRLKCAVDERCDLMPTLGISPLFDNLRSDPQFGKLLRRIRLPT